MLTFKDISLALNELVIFFEPLFSNVLSFLVELLVYNKFGWSAKWWVLSCLIARFRSLMYKANSQTPKTDSCGTPILIDAHSEV